MQVFVSEYVCGGGWADSNLPSSLAREGLAMLRAIVADVAQLPDCRVVTTLDDRRPDLNIEGVCPHRVSSPAEEQQVFAELVVQSDACLVIAPELGNVLHERCVLARAAGAGRVLNPAAGTIQLYSDKLALARFLQARGLPTVETSLLGQAGSLSGVAGPVVVKLRYGAGSQDIRTFPSLEAALEERSLGSRHGVDEMIVQPLIRGAAVSVGVIGRSHAHQWDILPTATQCLSEDGTFAYQGGRIPFADDAFLVVRQIVDAACSHLDGLAGYIGVDLVIPADDPMHPLIIEINPRLTTSYLGYRSLTPDNLAARMLETHSTAEPIRWYPRFVEFTPGGDVRYSEPAVTVSKPFSEVAE